ncbi:MAG: aldo/keto reductase [Chthonomonadaceae bacterium]|nr:aldo/keto reductase [Chthonomonadaceae bacterium]
MEKRELGKTGLHVTVLGFGGAELGYARAEVKVVESVLGAALDAGLNVIDTAECYGSGEETVGHAVSHRRKEFYLFTKCGHASGIDLPDWDVSLLQQSIDRSLSRLKTDYIDVLQLHSCTEEMLRKGEVVEVLNRAKDAGKTRFIGYSGDGAAARYAVESGAFDTLQTSINLADQQVLEETLPLAYEKGIGVIVKRPIANAVWKHETKPDNDYVVSYWERLQSLAYDFLKGEDDVEMALRFTLSFPGVSTAIVGTGKPGRWVENAEFVRKGNLSDAQIGTIRARWKEVAGEDWVGQV